MAAILRVLDTVNSEILAKFYFCKNLCIQNFVKIKCSQNSKIPLSLTDEVKSCASRAFLTWQISEFTVL